VRGFWPVYKRELFAFFVTPLAWVLVTVFLLLQGLHFERLLEVFANRPEVTSDQTPVQAFFGDTMLMYVILFLLVPPITMRLFAEERRSGTIELLLTAPVSIPALVLAKYFAALTTYIAMWAPTVLYIVILGRTGDVDWHVVGASYLGILLVGAGYLALGLLMSALTRSQFLALVLTAMTILGLFIIGIGEFTTREGTLTHDVCAHVSVWAHMNNFSNGIIDSRPLVYYTSMILVPLFVSVRAVQAWRWA